MTTTCPDCDTTLDLYTQVATVRPLDGSGARSYRSVAEQLVCGCCGETVEDLTAPGGDLAVRASTLDALVDEFPIAHHDVPDPTDGRWALVERNTVDRGEHFVSLHDSGADALAYHLDQEAPEYWSVEVLVDLDTGWRRPPTA